ncbi:holin [Demequina sp. SO4-18]|uniref:holin n=1 Tax=Demequina sp. SO4-18 TaxID=3401026 RepID=UPI003B5B2336
MSKYANRQFWIDAGDRAVATFAQASLGALTADVTGILEVDFAQVASVGGLAAAVSVLTSVALRGGAAKSDRDV